MLLYCDNCLLLSDADSSVCRISLSCVEYVLMLFRHCWRCINKSRQGWAVLIKSGFSHFSSQHFVLCLHISFTHIFTQCRVFIVLFVSCIFFCLTYSNCLIVDSHSLLELHAHHSQPHHNNDRIRWQFLNVCQKCRISSSMSSIIITICF